MPKNLRSVIITFLVFLLVPLSAFVIQNSNSKFTIYDEAKNKSYKIDKKDYIIGAVASEISPNSHKEAIKAQLVIAYTNAVRNKLKGNKVANVNTENNKGYIDKYKLKKIWGKWYNLYYSKIEECAKEVCGEVITYNGAPIVAAYHSLSSGKTESSLNVWGIDKKYLLPVLSDGDTFSKDNISKKIVTFKKYNEIIKRKLNVKNDNNIPENIIKSESGTVVSLDLCGQKVKGNDFRKWFNLNSACFDLELKDDSIIFTVRGKGHGVGLSMYGADFMARQGKNYKEILGYYYTDTEIMYMK